MARLSKAWMLCAGLALLGANWSRAAVSVISPAYRSDISGNTVIQIAAPGATSATVKCWQSGTGHGVDSTVATVSLTSGTGSFVFPGNSYPHGPLILRITAGTDTCYYQVYNTGGVPWKEGLAGAPLPPAASGMTVAFEDDFTGPLSISRTGTGATYGSHTIGYKDFSGIKFQDFESPVNPFFQRDTYLRIRADQSANSTGLICSIAQGRTGFKVKPPFYMECRFIAQRATGSWPAFWAMSIPNGTEEYGEIDVFEGYGNLAQKRFTAGIHNWPSDSARAYSLVLMDGSIPGTSAAEWSDTPHTYGCLVTATTTTFYLDNVPVWSCPSRGEWSSQDFYFLINYAFGGSSGWPVDLSRYNMQSDMYVDWVRIFTPSAPSGSLPVGTFKVRARHSNKYLDGRDTDPIKQFADTGSDNQKWTISDLGSGQYRLQEVASGRSAYVYNGSTADGARIAIWNWSGLDRQRWTALPVTSGYFRLVNVGSGKAMEVAGASMSDGATIQQWAIGTGANQEFAMESLSPPPPPSTLLPGTFKVVAKHSGKCLDGSNTDPVRQQTYLGNDNQKWTVSDLGGGQYRLQEVASGRSVYVYNGSTADGARIAIWNWSGLDRQRWTAQPASSGHFRLINVGSGKAMEVAGASMSDGATIQQWTIGTGANQEFAFQAP